MKEYMDKVPKIVIGQKAGDFLGEYMAGGRIVVMGLELGPEEYSVGRFFGTDARRPDVIRGRVKEALIEREIEAAPLEAEDKEFLQR